MSEELNQAEVAPTATDEGAEVIEGVHSEPLTTTIDLESFFNRQEEQRRQQSVEPQQEPEAEEAPPEEEKQPEPKEEEEEPVLSQRGEERFKKLLGELKERTREVEELKARMEKGPEPEAEAPSIFTQIEKAESFNDLQNLQAQAERVRNWARRNLHKEMIEGPNGEEISHDEIVEKLEIAEDILSKHIPQRAGLLQQRAQFDKMAEERFPGWKDPESEQGQWFAGMLKDPQTREVINRFPNGKMILGYIWKGLEAEKAESQSKPEPKAEAKPQQQRPSAPNLPGMRTQTVPSKIAPSQQQSKDQLKKQYMNSGMMTSTDLENYFNQTR